MPEALQLNRVGYSTTVAEQEFVADSIAAFLAAFLAAFSRPTVEHSMQIADDTVLQVFE